MSDPPYSTGKMLAISPRRPSSFTVSSGKCEASSHSMTCGRISRSANSRTLLRSCCCSSVNSKSIGSSRFWFFRSGMEEGAPHAGRSHQTIIYSIRKEIYGRANHEGAHPLRRIGAVIKRHPWIGKRQSGVRQVPNANCQVPLCVMPGGQRRRPERLLHANDWYFGAAPRAPYTLCSTPGSPSDRGEYKKTQRLGGRNRAATRAGAPAEWQQSCHTPGCTI